MLRSGLALLGYVALVYVALGQSAHAQTCADQDKACRARGHTAAECTKSTNDCLKTGRWIGPAGNEYPVSRKK